MAAKRLHPFSAAIANTLVLILSAALVSCGPEQSSDGTSDAETAEENFSSAEPTTDYSQYDVYVSSVVNNPEPVLIDVYALGFRVTLPLEKAILSEKHVVTYDPVLNGFINEYNVEVPYELGFYSFPGYYFVEQRVTIDYSDRIAPNMAIPIFTTGDSYVSVHQDRSWPDERVVIYSHDLTQWERTSITHPGLLLLFEREDRVFALTSREVWDVTSPEAIEFVQEVPKPFLQPKDLPMRPGSAIDQTVFYSFDLGDSLVLHLRRQTEIGLGEEFYTVDLHDFSYDVGTPGELDLISGYNYKAVEREDGWKVYYIGRDPANGIWVLDPFAEDGPAIIEQLPGVNVP